MYNMYNLCWYGMFNILWMMTYDQSRNMKLILIVYIVCYDIYVYSMYNVIVCYTFYINGHIELKVCDLYKTKCKNGSDPGFEPGTSCTQSRNHTTRPIGQIVILLSTRHI